MPWHHTLVGNAANDLREPELELPNGSWAMFSHGALCASLNLHRLTPFLSSVPHLTLSTQCQIQGPAGCPILSPVSWDWIISPRVKPIDFNSSISPHQRPP